MEMKLGKEESMDSDRVAGSVGGGPGGVERLFWEAYQRE